MEDYMSTEESSNEDDQLSYVVKKVTWESERLRKRKKSRTKPMKKHNPSVQDSDL